MKIELPVSIMFTFGAVFFTWGVSLEESSSSDMLQLLVLDKLYTFNDTETNPIDELREVYDEKNQLGQLTRYIGLACIAGGMILGYFSIKKSKTKTS